jgi:hypothetical protein
LNGYGGVGGFKSQLLKSEPPDPFLRHGLTFSGSFRGKPRGGDQASWESPAAAPAATWSA